MMEYARVSPHFGVVIKKASLASFDMERLLKLMETDSPYGETESVITFDSGYGEEDSIELVSRLERAGLKNIDDFFCV